MDISKLIESKALHSVCNSRPLCLSCAFILFYLTCFISIYTQEYIQNKKLQSPSTIQLERSHKRRKDYPFLITMVESTWKKKNTTR